MSLFDHDIRVPLFDLIVQLPAVRAFPECRRIRGRARVLDRRDRDPGSVRMVHGPGNIFKAPFRVRHRHRPGEILVLYIDHK
jgi:hypothetical protein